MELSINLYVFIGALFAAATTGLFVNNYISMRATLQVQKASIERLHNHHKTLNAELVRLENEMLNINSAQRKVSESLRVNGYISACKLCKSTDHFKNKHSAS